MARNDDFNVRKLARDIAEVKADVRSLKNRKTGLGYSSIENGFIDEYDADGKLVSRTGRQHDDTHGNVVLAGPKPPVPSDPRVSSIPGIVEVRWNGKFANDVVSPLDFKHVAGYVVPAGEPLVLSAQSGVITSELGDNFQVQVEPGDYWVYLVTWTLAGKYSDPAGPVAITVDTGDVDLSPIQDKLDELDEKYDGFITEAGELREKLDEAEQDLADHEARMDDADGRLTELTDETLPELQDALDVARNDLAGLDNDLSDANDRLTTAEGELEHLGSEIIPALTDDMAELRDTDLPALQDALDQTAQDVADQSAQLNDRLDDAFIAVGDADAKAVQAGLDAASAQALADDAREQADNALKTAISQGVNLYPNGSFENGTAGLDSFTYAEVIESNQARNGAHVLRYTGTGTGGASVAQPDFWSAKPGDVFYGSMWVMRTSETQDGVIGLRFQRINEAGTTYVTTVSRELSEFVVGEWTEISSYFTVTSDTPVTTGVRAFIYKVSGQANGVLIDSVRVIDVTEAREALAKANDAQATADNALASAGSAQNTASSALTMAGSKNAVFYGTTAPSGTGTAKGDLWRQVDASGDVIGEWQWTGSAWSKQMITSSAISNLDVGKLTAGTAFVSEAVINKLWAEVITARKMFVENLAIGSMDNLVVDPNFDNTELNAQRFNQSNGVVEGPYTSSDDGSHYIALRGGGTEVRYRLANSINTAGFRTHVESGEKYRIRYMAYGNGGAVRTRPQMSWLRTDGTNYLVSADKGTGYDTFTGTWGWVERVFTVPDDVVAGYLAIYRPASDGDGSLYIKSPQVTRMAGGNLIVGGSITGNHVQANSVAAKIAEFLELRADQITAGMIDSARLNVTELSALVANIIELNADRITAGTIGTARLNATEIASAVATIIQLNADRITSGTIATARLDVEDIAGKTAAFQQVDISNLFVTTGTFTEAVINRLWVDFFHTRKITTEVMAVGSFSNMFPDPNLTDTEGWPSSVEFAPGEGIEGRNAIRIFGTGGSSSWYYGLPSLGRVLPVVGGRSYRVKAWIKPETVTPTTATVIRLFHRLYAEDGSYISPSPQTLRPESVPPAGEWTQIDGVVKVPDGETKHLRLAFGPNISAAYPVGASVLFADPIITEMAGGELIVDGAVTAGSLAADAITGKTIRGGKIIGSSYRLEGPDDGSASSMNSIRMDFDGLGPAFVMETTYDMPGVGTHGVLRPTIGVSATKGYDIPVVDIKTPVGGSGVDGSFMDDGSVRGVLRLMPGDRTATGSTKTATPTLRWDGGVDLVVNSHGGIDPVALSSRIRFMSSSAPGQILAPNSYFELNGAQAVRIMDNEGTPSATVSSIKSQGVYNRTVTFSANMYVGPTGYIARSTSSAKAKVAIEDIPQEQIDALLNVKPRWWFDRGQAEALADYMAYHNAYQPMPAPDIDVPNQLKRIPGVVAEEVQEAGATAFVTTEKTDDGEVLTGVAYDRIGAALLGVVKELREEVASLKARVTELENQGGE